MSQKIVKVAQLGAGYWGPNLLRNVNSHPGFELKTVVDLAEERREYVAKQYPQTKVSGSIEDVLNDPEIQAVIVATPADTHASLAEQILQAGKHVLVEKPLARTVDEVKKISLAASRRNLVAMVGHTFIYNPAVRYLKELIDSGELGQVRYVYSQRLNLGRIRSDIDALWNFGPHDVSIVQYLFGDPNPLWAYRCGVDYVQRGVEDVVFLNIMYPNKILVNIHVSWLDPQKTRKMVIVGSEKMVIYDDAAEQKIAIYDKGIDRMSVLGEHMDYDMPRAFGFSHRAGSLVYPEIKFEEPLSLELSHFWDCIVNGVECETGTEHALKVIKILSSASSLGPKKTHIITARENEENSLPPQSQAAPEMTLVK